MRKRISFHEKTRPAFANRAVGDVDNVHIRRFLHRGLGGFRVRSPNPEGGLVAAVAIAAIAAVLLYLLPLAS